MATGDAPWSTPGESRGRNCGGCGCGGWCGSSEAAGGVCCLFIYEAAGAAIVMSAADLEEERTSPCAAANGPVTAAGEGEGRRAVGVLSAFAAKSSRTPCRGGVPYPSIERPSIERRLPSRPPSPTWTGCLSAVSRWISAVSRWISAAEKTPAPRTCRLDGPSRARSLPPPPPPPPPPSLPPSLSMPMPHRWCERARPPTSSSSLSPLVTTAAPPMREEPSPQAEMCRAEP